jgi:hypothetical protein
VVAEVRLDGRQLLVRGQAQPTARFQVDVHAFGIFIKQHSSFLCVFFSTVVVVSLPSNESLREREKKEDGWRDSLFFRRHFRAMDFEFLTYLFGVCCAKRLNAREKNLNF